MGPEQPTAPPGGGIGGGGGGGGEAVAGTCPCGCLCCGPASWCRSLKRKLDEREAEARSIACVGPNGDDLGAGVARVEIENEVAALRETLVSHQQSVQQLQAELEEERSAAASAATEAMSMILRLQREKAEAQMEARQFKRLAEEKMAHDEQEIATLEDLLFKRDQTAQALSCEVQAYRHRLLSYGIDGDTPPSEPQTPSTAMAACAVPQFDLPQDYPPLRCTSDDVTELDKYPSGETPREHLHKIEQIIFQLERMPSSNFCNKGVVAVQSPRRQPRHLRNFSSCSFGSGLEFNKGEEFPVAFDSVSDYGGRDDMSDRVYPVDAVHGASEDYVSTPRELQNRRGVVDGAGAGEAEIKNLYMRLQALEADRESMKRTLISMGTDKAQMVLLKEIAQQICKEVAPERRIINKPSPKKRFSIMSMIKGVISFVFWRKKSSQVKYTFGLTTGNVGLLLLLDKSPRLRHGRFLTHG